MVWISKSILNATWNTHDWEGEGSKWLNLCTKEVGWLILPRHVTGLFKVENGTLEAASPVTISTDGYLHIRDSIRFRFTNLTYKSVATGILTHPVEA